MLIIAQLLSLSAASCHADDLKKSLEEITKIHRDSVDILIAVLDGTPYDTITYLDLEGFVDAKTAYDAQKRKYVTAAKKIYELSWKLERSFNDNGKWRRFSKSAVQIRNKTNILNQTCFNEYKIVVDMTGGEGVLVDKLLEAVLEMFIAETFLNEHFNHLAHPYSKI